MGLDIFSIISPDVDTLARSFCNEKFHRTSKEDFEYMVANIGSFLRFRSNVVEFAIASLTLPTWYTYNCLITAADALNVRTVDLASSFSLVPEREETKAFAAYATGVTGLGSSQVSAQVGFLTQAIEFVNTVANLRCYQHCREQCLREHPQGSEAYWKCLGSCIEEVRC